jgi:protein-S-isoprenylcysteine O-methyltransferase Ste14
MRTYGLVVYAGFVAVLAYFVGWVEGLVVPRTIDDGPAGSAAWAIVVDLFLLGVFAAQHSVMARPWFKRHWTRVVPAAAERSTYVLLATVVLALMMWLWRPLPGMVWDVDPAPVRIAVYAVSFGGWGLALLSTFAIDHFDLFGVSQVLRHHDRRSPGEPTLVEPLLYRVVRHPLYLGFLIAFWAAPTMSAGRLLFAAGMTGYVLMAIRLEERDLVRTFGERYRAYRRRVPGLVPRLPRRVERPKATSRP